MHGTDRARRRSTAYLLALALSSLPGCGREEPADGESERPTGVPTTELERSPIVVLNESDFDREVLEAGRPVLVEFGSVHCPPCVRMAPALERLAEELAGRAVVARVDVDEQPALARRFAIRSIPVFLLFDEGEFVARLDGERPVAELRQRLEPLVAAAPPNRPPDSSP